MARDLNTDQHAGSGPALTGSGLDLATGNVTDSRVLDANDPTTDMVVGSTRTDVTDGNIEFGTELIRATFDKIINWRLRYEPMYKQFATVRAIRETAYPGSKVTMFRTGAQGLGLVKDALSEYEDPDAVALPGLEDKLDVTVNEYGNSTVVTSRIKRYSWADIDPMQAEYVGRNLRDSVDATYMESIYDVEGGWLGAGFRQAVLTGDDTMELTATGSMAQDKMFPVDATAGKKYGPLMVDAAKLGGDPGQGTAGLTASHVRRIVAHFRSLGVRPMADGYYVALITPEIALQLREDSATEGANGWRYPHLDGSWNGSLLSGTVGVFEGVRFIEGAQFKGLDKGDKIPANTNSIIEVAPATGTTHNVLFLGSEGICDVIVEDPHTVVTPTTDKFGRLQGLGWIGTWGSQVYDSNAGLLVSVAV